MDKNILQQYLHAKARVKYLRTQAEKLRRKTDRLIYTDYGIAGDTVSRGKRGKKPLGTVRISGFPVPEYQKTVGQLKRSSKLLKAEELKLGKLAAGAEEFIASISDVEMRDILSFYYIKGMTWVQVAGQMGVLCGVKKYSADGCRKKHDRFIKSL